MASRGQNLIELGIILALIVIFGVVTLTFLGSNVKEMFGKSENKYESYKPFDWKTNKSSTYKGIPPGTLGGKPDAPVQECQGNECTIDFGTFVLEGVPKDYNDFVSSNGTSGGTDKVAAMMYQIAEQLAAAGNIEESNEVKKLTSLGHNMAVTMKYIEQMVKDCNGIKTCIEEKGTSAFPEIDGSDELDETFYDYHDYYEFNAKLSTMSISRLRNMIENPDYVDTEGVLYSDRMAEEDKHDNLALEFNKQWDSIRKDPKVSQQVKNVVEELAYDIAVISEDFSNNYEFLNPSGDIGYRDPISGVWQKFLTEEDFVDEDFYNYRASKITPFDSSIICASGKGSDTGKKCH